MTIRGKTYAKGLGVHAAALVRFRLGKACTRFTADIGIDDEVKGSGSAEFEVWADGKSCSTGPTLLTGSSPVEHVDVDITGRRELRLFVGTGPMATGRTMATGPTRWCTVRRDHIFKVRPKLAPRYLIDTVPWASDRPGTDGR